MGKERKPFRFKRFEVEHCRSSIKVGVDGVLIGAWAEYQLPTPERMKILDVGCGCGVIALMLAQRFPKAIIEGIDIDPASVEEASLNAEKSPWSERVAFKEADFLEMKSEGEYDLIVSNPPFFDSGVNDTSSSRMTARHQKSLPLKSLLEKSSKLLMNRGVLAIIVPSEFEEELKEDAIECGLTTERICRVRGHERAPWKRVMLQFRKNPAGSESIEESKSGTESGVGTRFFASASSLRPQRENNIETETLTLETEPGNPTAEYKELCHEFYLKF